MHWILREWQSTLTHLHSDRKGWKGLPPISRIDTVQVLQRFLPGQQKQLLNELAGAFQTNTQQSAWNSEVTEACSFCGQPDTRHHRVFTCAATQAIRDQYATLFQALIEQGSEWHELPVIFEHETAEMIRTIHWTTQEPDIPHQMFMQLQLIDQMSHQLAFYTDGSCMYPHHPNCRYTGFSVVVDLAATDAERIEQVNLAAQGQPLKTLAPLMVARTPGDQNIYRAELYAILYICERFHNTCIYSDSQAALSTVSAIMKAPCMAMLEPLPETDLIQRLWPILHQGSRVFHKVAAHAETEPGLEPLTRYHRLGNKLANDIAIIATKQLHPSFACQLSDTAHEVVSQCEQLYQLYNFHLEAFAHRAALQAQASQDETHEAEDAQRLKKDICTLCASYATTHVFEQPQPGHTMLQESAWGPTLARAMLQWMQEFSWPTQPDQHELQRAGLTWYEMVVSFMLYTNMYFPLRSTGESGTEILLVLESDAEVEAYNLKFSDYANTFAIFYKQVVDLLQHRIWPTVERGLVRSMYLQGASIFTSGFFWRPSYPLQAEVARIFREYHLTNKGPNFSQVPRLSLEPERSTLDTVRGEIIGGWHDRSKRFRKAAALMRQFRCQPMQALSF